MTINVKVLSVPVFNLARPPIELELVDMTRIELLPPRWLKEELTLFIL